MYWDLFDYPWPTSCATRGGSSGDHRGKNCLPHIWNIWGFWKIWKTLMSVPGETALVYTIVDRVPQGWGLCSELDRDLYSRIQCFQIFNFVFVWHVSNLSNQRGTFHPGQTAGHYFKYFRYCTLFKSFTFFKSLLVHVLLSQTDIMCHRRPLRWGLCEHMLTADFKELKELKDFKDLKDLYYLDYFERIERLELGPVPILSHL